MKPEQSNPTENAEALGRAVRTIVEAALHSLGPTPTTEFLFRIEKLAANVALWGARMNLTAHPDDADEIAFHVIDSLMPYLIASAPDSGMLRGAFADGSKILDLGSGAGFPGLVLAAACGAGFTLIESRRKRSSFLAVAIAEMGLHNVSVDPSRAEPGVLRPEFDLVTARAFGKPDDFYPLAAAGAKPGGVAMLYANPSQRLSLESAQSAGLESYTRIAYQVSRRGIGVDRVLALWRKAGSKPA